jgi:hypothetical protein
MLGPWKREADGRLAATVRRPPLAGAAGS